MPTLTASERRAVLVVALLFSLGALHDFWRAGHPRLTPRPPIDPATARAEVPSDSFSRPGLGAPAASDSGPVERPLDLNRADARALDGLPGVGPVLAGRI